jgi:hypothetical protein
LKGYLISLEVIEHPSAL